ncbi:MAG: hypothetical protein ACAH12_02065 [Methylophilaceae bacterium]
MRLRDEVQIFIHPHRLMMMRIKRGIRKEIVAREVIPVENFALSTLDSPAITETSELKRASGVTVNVPLWQPAVTSLGLALNDSKWRNAQSEIVLSNHFSRYAVIPWNAELTSATERQAYLRHCFFLAYGEPARQWDLRMSPAGYGVPSIASGIDTQLLEALDLEFRQAGMKVNRIYPHLVVAVNAARQYWVEKQKKLQSAWFVTVEQGRLCLGLLEQYQWRLLKSFAAQADISTQLEALMHRESIIAAIDTTGWPVLLYWPELTSGHAITLQDREVFSVLSEDEYLDGSLWRDESGHPSATEIGVTC